MSPSGFTSTGFMRTSGTTPAARACKYWAVAISPPVTTRALLAMFMALNGATRTPRRAKLRASAVARRLFPAQLEQPCTITVGMRLPPLPGIPPLVHPWLGQYSIAKGMELTVLGACGSWPAPGEATSGYLLADSGFVLAIDLGTGTFARLQQRVSAETVSSVVISHAHPDHFVDLYALFYFRFFDQGSLRVVD